MQKVISINLNGNAYQLEESGYDALAAYLAQSTEQLAGNPDRDEILSDLEQAIADKCQAFLGPHKTVILHSEIQSIITEMGPVETGTAEEKQAAPGGGAPAHGAKPGADPGPRARRLYRIPEGSMLGGICTGLASYFQVDVTLVRAAFVVMALITQGAAIIAYIVMMFIIPEASTARERAEAGGAPFNARDIVERAKGRYAEESRRWRREWRRYRRQHARPQGRGPTATVAALLPLFTLVHFAVFIITASVAIALVNTGEFLGWSPPDNVPLWGVLLVLFVIHQVAVSPIRGASQWGALPETGAGAGWFAFWHAVAWLVGVAFVIWIASNHLPEIREFLQRMPEIVQDFALAMRRLVAGDR